MATKDPKLSKKGSPFSTTTTTNPTPPKTKKTNYIRAGVAILAITVALTQNFFRSAATDLGLFLGDIQPFNTAGCEVVPGGLEACEDIHLHRESGLAFMACGNAEARKDWFPPMARLNASADDIAFQDKFVIYNVAVRFCLLYYGCSIYLFFCFLPVIVNERG
jgi:hypothetical protein